MKPFGIISSPVAISTNLYLIYIFWEKDAAIVSSLNKRVDIAN
jgi:hypothetical protein